MMPGPLMFGPSRHLPDKILPWDTAAQPRGSAAGMPLPCLTPRVQITNYVVI